MPNFGVARSRFSSLWTFRLLLLLAIALLILALTLGRLFPPSVTLWVASTPTQTVTSSPVPVLPSLTASLPPISPSPQLSPSPSPVPSISPSPSLPNSPFSQGTIILAMDEGGYSHLFLFQPQSQFFSRLTSGPWNDVTPALSPDGKLVAFASNRGGNWDLYLMDLTNGETSQITNTPEYDSAPSWSPDGLWLVYESYLEENKNGSQSANLELIIRPVAGNQPPIRLTDHPAADYSPVWSPKGRQIAFVSTRSGDHEIWIADLDQIDKRFRNISSSPETTDVHPAWSPSGDQLAWASRTPDGFQNIFLWDSTQAASKPRQVASGGWPAWDPDGTTILTNLETSNQTYLTGYDIRRSRLTLPPTALDGSLEGLTWGISNSPLILPDLLDQAARLTLTPAWLPALTPMTGLPEGRRGLIPLKNIEAPQPMLQDMVDESFQALRERTASEAGWDFLSSLENAYVPLTIPLDPGMGNDWLYTGRAFSFNTLPLNAGWVVVVREDFGPRTYWRVFIRTRFQDGSKGIPLHDLPWDFSARYSGDPHFYEEGGRLAESIPPGYWLDFTKLAASFGWERLPALISWRSSFPAARLNEFVLTDQLDWRSAMLEIYPPEVLITPTPLLPTTQVPSATLKPTQTPPPTRTRWPSRTPTPTRTLTPTPPMQLP